MKRLVPLMLWLVAACDGGDPKPAARPFASVTAVAGELLQVDTLRQDGYVIVTTTRLVIDTTRDIVSVDTVVRPAPILDRGIPLGSAALNQEGSPEGQNWANLSSGTPAALFKNLQWAERNKMKAVVFNLPGGQHNSVGPNLSMIGGRLRYDEAKYRARVEAFATKAVRDSVAKYCGKKFDCMISAYDEPHVSGGDDGAGTIQGNTWGEKGWMTKAKVDRGCEMIRRAVPGIPVGVQGGPSLFYPELPAYTHCQFIRAQYSWRMSANKKTNISPKGAREKWYENEVRAAKGVPLALSINIINGGIQDRDPSWDCKTQGGVKGQRQPNCAMIPDSVRAYLLYFGPRTVGGMMMWRQDTRYTPRLLPVLKEVRRVFDTLPYRRIGD